MKSIRLHTWGDPQHPPLLLVHGLTEAGTAWPDAVQRWDTAWHIQAVDLRGHGHSPRFDAATTPLMFGTMVDDIIEVLKTIGPATVIGHSLGGRVAAVAATVRPDLVRALVLEDPALTEGTATPPGFIDEQRSFLARFDDDDVAAERHRVRRETNWTGAEIDRWAECKPLVDRHMVDHLDLGDIYASDVFADLSCPTLVLYDADGPLARYSLQTSNALVHIRFLDGVGHCIRRDDPTAYHAIVDPWLDTHGR